MKKTIVMLVQVQFVCSVFSMGTPEFMRNTIVDFEELNKRISLGHPDTQRLKNALQEYEDFQNEEEKEEALEKIKNIAQKSDHPHPFAQGLAAELLLKKEKISKKEEEEVIHYFSSCCFYPKTKVDLGDFYLRSNNFDAALDSFVKGCFPIVLPEYLLKNLEKEKLYFHDEAFTKLKELSLQRKSDHYEKVLNDICKTGLSFWKDSKVNFGLVCLQKAAKLGCKQAEIELPKIYFQLPNNQQKLQNFLKLCTVIKENTIDNASEIVAFLKLQKDEPLALFFSNILRSGIDHKELAEDVISVFERNISTKDLAYEKIIEQLKSKAKAEISESPQAVYLQGLLSVGKATKNKQQSLAKQLVLVEKSIQEIEKKDKNYSKNPFAIRIRRQLIKYYFSQEKLEEAETVINKLPEGTQEQFQCMLGHHFLARLKDGIPLLEKAALKDCNAALKVGELFLCTKDYEGTLLKNEVISLLKTFIPHCSVIQKLHCLLILSVFDNDVPIDDQLNEVLKSLSTKDLRENNGEEHYTLALAHYLRKKDTEVFNLFKEAYDLGYTNAAGYLGTMLLLGEGVKPSLEKAYNYLKNASKTIKEQYYDFNNHNVVSKCVLWLGKIGCEDILFGKNVINHLLDLYVQSKDLRLLRQIYFVFKHNIKRINTYELENDYKKLFEKFKKYENDHYDVLYLIGKIYFWCAKNNINFTGNKKNSTMQDHLEKADNYLSRCLEQKLFNEREEKMRTELVANCYHKMAQCLDGKELLVDKAESYYNKAYELYSSSELRTSQFLASLYANFLLRKKKGEKYLNKSLKILKRYDELDHFSDLLGKIYYEGRIYPCGTIEKNLALAEKYFKKLINNDNKFGIEAKIGLLDIYFQQFCQKRKPSLKDQIFKLLGELKTQDSKNEKGYDDFEKDFQKTLLKQERIKLEPLVFDLRAEDKETDDNDFSTFEQKLLTIHDTKERESLVLEMDEQQLPHSISGYRSDQAKLLILYYLYLAKGIVKSDNILYRLDDAYKKILSKSKNTSINNTAAILCCALDFEKTFHRLESLTNGLKEWKNLNDGNSEIVKRCLNDIRIKSLAKKTEDSTEKQKIENFFKELERLGVIEQK